ncbi:MAG: type I restriction endonuclease subunit R, partial [Methylococcaceae bacterium]|nr:type I restriction endonuclease subunit R [Methylococcaceae bacterium]
MTEDQLEQETLSWLADVGYTPVYGPDIAVDGNAPERSNYTQVLLVDRLRQAIHRLNPLVPLVAREDALQQVLNLESPVLLSANRHFHRLLVNGVPVQYQKEGETRGDFVRLVDWDSPSDFPSPQPSPGGRGSNLNEWLAINQFSIKGPKYTRRPDIILFVNGLPLV